MKFKGVMLLFLIFVIPIVSAAIVINEFELNPPGSDGGKEWVELFNDGSSRNVSGWYVQDKDGDNYTLPNMTIGGNSFFVFDNLTGLINTDQNLKLYNNFNVLQDSTGNFSDTDNDDNTWQRVPDVNGNFTFKNETEGLPNQITEITNKTISNSCLIKDDDFSLFVNVTGFCIDEVIFSVISNGSQINFTGENSEGDNYFVDLSSSALVNNITWTVYTRNCFNTTTKNGDESFYVNNQTGLSVFPSDPDGLNGWYVTEPTFVLENGDAAMSHYRWNGDDALNYTGAFMLEDAPNDGNTTGGIHELKYWSNVSCKLENKMNETFMFDFTNPFVDDISPENGSTINNRKPTISALLDETYQSNSGIDIEIVAMSLNGVGPIVINKTPSGSLDYRIEHFPLVDLPLGQNNVSINVTDKAGRNTIFDWFFFVGDPILLAMNVYSPEDMIYSEKKVPINISLNEEVEILEYKDNSDVHPRFRRLCRGCDSYSRDKSFKDGWHNLTFRATLNPIVEANVSFFVDSKDPLIRGTSPTRGFIDSKIDVEFQELNPDKLLLTYGNESDLVIIEINISEDCVLDRNYECTTSLNLSYFNGGEIFYWFNLTDVAGNYDISRERDVTVDTIAPEINSFNLTVLGRKAEFVFNITELNFEEVNYIDYEDRRPRERRLCNRLKEGICEKTKTFRSGDHNLTINVLDEAGNFDVIDGVLFSV